MALQRLNGSVKKVKGMSGELLACFAQNSSQGSLIDKTQRIEMDNPVFAKLQRAILHPSRSKEWFGMAEQIINAVYALAEHPDVFCNDLIRKLSTRAFNRPKTAPNEQPDDGEKQSADLDAEASDNPADRTMHEGDVTMLDPTQPSQAASDDKGGEKDTGDAFELSQLLFIVGHVAIKHIVFLELVEREWKRQKDERQAGKSLSLLLLIHYLMSVKRRKSRMAIRRMRRRSTNWNKSQETPKMRSEIALLLFGKQSCYMAQHRCWQFTDRCWYTYAAVLTNSRYDYCVRKCLKF